MGMMGAVWSTIASMIGPGVDERDLRLAVRMVREHHAQVMDAWHRMTPVRWSRTAHIHAIFVVNPMHTEWDHIERMFESVSASTSAALHEQGIPDMLRDLQAYQDNPNSIFEWDEHDHCSVCHSIAHDESDVDLMDGPIGTERFFARHGNRTLPGGWSWPNNHGANTGQGRNRRVWGDNM